MNDQAKKSLRKILRYARAGKLGAFDRKTGSCAYSIGEKFCAIGCLLTPAQHKKVRQAGYNTGKGVHGLTEIFPDLFEERLGLAPHDAAKLQRAHDHAYDSSEYKHLGPKEGGKRRQQFQAGLERCIQEGAIMEAFFRYNY